MALKCLLMCLIVFNSYALIILKLFLDLLDKRITSSVTSSLNISEGESIVVSTRHHVTHHNDSVIYCWIPTSCFAAIFCVYNIVHAAIITHGFVRTCTQYRGFLAREIHAAGDHVTVIHFRLTCQAIYDFMDYMQKDTLNNSRLGSIINTGVSLQLAIIASWASVALWIAVTVYTARRAARERDVLTCCGN